jgi:hypothetical protein
MKVNWFDRGRDAMTEGRPRIIRDARISSSDRQAWYAGWQHQASLNSAKSIPAADRAEAVAALQEILETLKPSS